MKALILSQDGAQTAETAARLIREGELVALPTETVYGLSANIAGFQKVVDAMLSQGVI